MSEFKGTPGPWSCEYNGYFFDIKPKGSHQDLAMTHDNEYIGIDKATDEANAKLIAAAPELLEALQDMVESYQYEASMENPSLLKARAAIAKALGQ